MIKTGLRDFEIIDDKPVFSSWFAPIDISEWLGSDTIGTVSFTAIKESDLSDATSIVLDTGACTYSGSDLMPYIKAGVAGEGYLVKMQVTSANGAKEQWTIRFKVVA